MKKYKSIFAILVSGVQASEPGCEPNCILYRQERGGEVQRVKIT